MALPSFVSDAGALGGCWEVSGMEGAPDDDARAAALPEPAE